MQRAFTGWVAAMVLSLALSSCVGGSGSNSSSPTRASSSQASSGSLRLTSAAFAENASIPKQYSCDGENTSPPLAWSNAPAGTASFALIVDDPDAPSGTFDHWVVFDLPPSVSSLPAAIPNGDTIPQGAKQGRNGAGTTAYLGPCPPQGSADHHYRFTLYALDAMLGLPPGAKKAEIQGAAEPHILAQTTLVGLYKR